MKKQLKRMLSILLCLTLLMGAFSSTCLAASKTSGSCGKNAKWSFNKKSKTLTISGKGEIKDKWSKYLGDKKVTVVIKEGITTLGTDAFANTDIKKLTLPNSLTTIKGAFGGMDAEMPSTITIPKNVKKIHTTAFVDGFGLKSIKVASDNKNYSSKDGVLYNKAKTTLICCPAGKTGSYTIPNSTKTVSEYAFASSALKKLTVPASVTKIKEGAFYAAGFEELRFLGRVPSGLYGELEYGDDEFYIESIVFPQEYYDEWNSFQAKVEKTNQEIKWYYWYYS